MPPTGAFLTGAPLVEILIGIAVLGIASMCLGLLVSALVSTSEKAMPILVLLTMVQVILSGGVVSLVNKLGLTQLAYIAPSRWGFGAVASTVDLNIIPGLGRRSRPAVGARPLETGCTIWACARPGGGLHAVHLARHAPPRPAPPQVMTAGRTARHSEASSRPPTPPTLPLTLQG